MNVKLFQIVPLKDDEKVMFCGYELTQKHGGVNPSIYEKVFDGELPIKRLDDVFQIFNTKLPEDYSGRSMSVSAYRICATERSRILWLIEIMHHRIMTPTIQPRKDVSEE